MKMIESLMCDVKYEMWNVELINELINEIDWMWSVEMWNMKCEVLN